MAPESDELSAAITPVVRNAVRPRAGGDGFIVGLLLREFSAHNRRDCEGRCGQDDHPSTWLLLWANSARCC